MKRIKKIRADVIKDIYRIIEGVESQEIFISDIEDGFSPILQVDEFDEDNDYTLDKVFIRDGKVYFTGSSCFADFTWSQENLCVEALCGVLDFLEEHEEEISEL